MEEVKIKKSSNNNYFSQRRNLIKISNILEFLNLEEVLKISSLNSLIYKFVKMDKKTEELRRIKLEYLNNHILNLNSIELLIKNIIKEMQIGEEQIFEFFAFYIFKNIFCRLINFHQHRSDTILSLMKYLKISNYTYDSGVVQFTDNQFSEKLLFDSLNVLLNNNRVYNLMKITISNSNLTDECLDPIVEYMNRNASLKIIILSGNQIGQTEKSNHLLHSIKNNSNLEFVNLDMCYFSSKSVDILKEIYISPKNRIKSLSLYFNMMSLEDAYNLFNVDLEKNVKSVKKIGISFKYSPEYNLNKNNREVVFGKNFILNKYDDREFYEIYVDNLIFNSLTLVNVDSRIEYVIERILNSNFYLDSLVTDLYALSDKICNLVLEFIKRQKSLKSVSLSEMKEKINPMTGLTYYKIFNFLSVIKECQNIKYLNFWNVFAKGWTKELLETVKNIYIEELSISNCIEKEECELITELIKSSRRISNAGISKQCG